jgi:flagellar biosynthesis protein FlhA
VAAKTSTDLDRLVEAARAAIGPAIVASLATEGTLEVITIEPRLQQTMLECLHPTDSGAALVLAPGLAETVVSAATQRFSAASAAGAKPVIACAPQLRAPLRRLLAMSGVAAPVLSYTEIASSSVAITALGVIDAVVDAVPGR